MSETTKVTIIFILIIADVIAVISALAIYDAVLIQPWIASLEIVVQEKVKPYLIPTAISIGIGILGTIVKVGARPVR